LDRGIGESKEYSLTLRGAQTTETETFLGGEIAVEERRIEVSKRRDHGSFRERKAQKENGHEKRRDVD